MASYTAITIIYNPNSTGPGKTLAEQLKQQLGRLLPTQEISIIPTEHAGHAEELAYRLAKATKRPLIVSSSGDGGYHEVVNGIMRAQAEGAWPVASLLPAGNANDHFRNLHKRNLAGAIHDGTIQIIDLLKLTYRAHGRTHQRYAHSYIGVGLTPQAGHELNKHHLNRLMEVWIVLKVLFFLRPVRLRISRRVRTYDSLIFSNIGKMSKILSLSDVAKATDGVFEITAFRRRNKLQLIATLLKASTRGLKGNRQAAEFSFRTVAPTQVQLDGEIHTLPAKTTVHITIEPSVLRCIV